MASWCDVSEEGRHTTGGGARFRPKIDSSSGSGSGSGSGGRAGYQATTGGGGSSRRLRAACAARTASRSAIPRVAPTDRRRSVWALSAPLPLQLGPGAVSSRDRPDTRHTDEGHA